MGFVNSAGNLEVAIRLLLRRETAFLCGPRSVIWSPSRCFVFQRRRTSSLSSTVRMESILRTSQWLVGTSALSGRTTIASICTALAIINWWTQSGRCRVFPGKCSFRLTVSSWRCCRSVVVEQSLHVGEAYPFTARLHGEGRTGAWCKSSESQTAASLPPRTISMSLASRRRPLSSIFCSSATTTTFSVRLVWVCDL